MLYVDSKLVECSTQLKVTTHQPSHSLAQLLRCNTSSDLIAKIKKAEGEKREQLNDDDNDNGL